MSYKEIFTQEGFPFIYEWFDEPGKKYEAHTHKGKVSLYIEDGDVTFTFTDHAIVTISAGSRFDVPPNTEHTALVGENGCRYIVAEMIQGDS